MNNTRCLIAVLSFFITQNLFSQPTNFIGFENQTDKQEFTQSTFLTEGFDVLRVDGFNLQRAIADSKYARTGKNSLRVAYPKG